MVTGKESSFGFTILEVLVSIVLAGMLIITFSIMIANINIANDRARDLTITSSFVENKVEDLRNGSFLGLPADGSTIDFTSEMANTFAPPRSATYTITDLNTSLKQIDFVISYGDHGRTQSVSYSTSIGELGVGQY